MMFLLRMIKRAKGSQSLKRSELVRRINIRRQMVQAIRKILRMRPQDIKETRSSK